LHGADLAFADLGESTITGARFCKANLYGADLRKIQDPEGFVCVDVRGANIKNVRHAPAKFIEYSKHHGAVEFDIDEWLSHFEDPNDTKVGEINCYERDPNMPITCSKPKPQF
jgi:hypothetical protein